jgi:hypothetical protein
MAMKELLDSLSTGWAALRERQQPNSKIYTVDSTDGATAGMSGTVIKRNAMYFSVRINEMRLSNNARWFSVYDPLVVVVVEFGYGKTRVAIPSVIGPQLLAGHVKSGVPQFGTVLNNVRVTGPHPYLGGPIDISVQLYRVQRENHANAMLKIVESLSRAAGAGQLAAIAQTGATLLQGLESLIGLEETIYLAGQRMSLAHTPLEPLKAETQALLVPPLPPANATLKIKKGELHVDTGEATSQVYGDSDFVLFSVDGAERREDENVLPFYQLKRDAMAALSDGEDSIKRAKAILLTAYQQMRKSDDVTPAECERFFEEWIEEFNAEEARLQRMGSLSYTRRSKDGAVPELDAAMRKLAL